MGPHIKKKKKKHIMKIWKWICNSFLTASKPRWLLIGWQREQEVLFLRRECVIVAAELLLWKAGCVMWRWNSVRTGHTMEPPASHAGGCWGCVVCVCWGKRTTAQDRRAETCKNNIQNIHWGVESLRPFFFWSNDSSLVSYNVAHAQYLYSLCLRESELNN